MRKQINIKAYFALAVGYSCLSCTNFLELGVPHNQVVTQTVYSDEALAEGAMVGIYREMFSGNGFASGGSGSVTVLAGLSADEIRYTGSSADIQAFAANMVLPPAVNNLGVWSSAYKTIYRANDIIEGLESSALDIRSSKAGSLRGEALFIRAFAHFYLFNLYGPIPLALTADYRVTRSLPRETEEIVYRQIEHDLHEAYGLLPADYALVHGERIRPTRWAAAALLARVYLYQQNWKEAAAKAEEVINQNHLYRLSDEPNDVFIKNSDEAIWQLLPFTSTMDTYDGNYAIPSETSVLPPNCILSKELLDRFKPGDKRTDAWIGRFNPVNSMEYYAFPFKYKVKQNAFGTSGHVEYSTLMRIAEQYFIRAEARAKQGDVGGAWDDINLIREKRRLLSQADAVSNEDIFDAIESERYLEFFHEWGHRWFDLKRWDKADVVLGAVKTDWRSEAKLLPIPQRELDSNPSLVQNLGYGVN